MEEAMQASRLAAPTFFARRSISTCVTGASVAQLMNVFPRAATSSESPLSAKIDRKSTRLNSSHQIISYAVFCLKKKTTDTNGGRISVTAAPQTHKLQSLIKVKHRPSRP